LDGDVPFIHADLFRSKAFFRVESVPPTRPARFLSGVIEVFLLVDVGRPLGCVPLASVFVAVFSFAAELFLDGEFVFPFSMKCRLSSFKTSRSL